MRPDDSSAAPRLRGRRLAANSVWNLIGQGAPLLVAVFAIPVLIDGLGTDGFGILTLGWAVIGYFGLFDLGLGRAITKTVAESLGAGQAQRVPALARAGLFLMLLLGLLAGGLLALVAPGLVQRVFQVPAELQAETVGVFRLLALATPFVVTSSGLRGLLEAHQRFGLVNCVRLPLGVFTFAAPLIVLTVTTSLEVIVGVLTAGRIVAWLAHVVLCARIVPRLWRETVMHAADVRELLTFGGWLAVSNFVGPLLLYVDRFLIAAVVSTAAVAYYGTPQQVLVRLLIVPSSIIGVMFPAFSQSLVSHPEAAQQLYRRTQLIVASIMFPTALLVVLVAEPALAWWIDPEFAAESALVARILAVAVAINSLGLVAQAFVQAAGRPDLTAKLHLVELPLYAVYLWTLLGGYGIEGAAVAWAIRVSLSTLALVFLARYTRRTLAAAIETP